MLKIDYLKYPIELPEVQAPIDHLGLPDDTRGGSAVPDIPPIAAAPDMDRLLVPEQEESRGLCSLLLCPECIFSRKGYVIIKYEIA